MTLAELIQGYRPHIEDASVGVRRSWEETFKYTLKHYPPETRLEDFDLEILAEKMFAEGIQPRFVDGYVKRWRDLLQQQRETRLPGR
jgi:hypothetical protein